MTTAAEEGSKRLPNATSVAYSDATATIEGTTAWIATRIAIRKLCLNRTGGVIWYPLSHTLRGRADRGGRTATELLPIISQFNEFMRDAFTAKLNCIG